MIKTKSISLTKINTTKYNLSSLNTSIFIPNNSFSCKPKSYHLLFKSFSLYKRKYKDSLNNNNSINLKYNLELSYEDECLNDEIGYKGNIYYIVIIMHLFIVKHAKFNNNSKKKDSINKYYSSCYTSNGNNHQSTEVDEFSMFNIPGINYSKDKPTLDLLSLESNSQRSTIDYKSFDVIKKYCISSLKLSKKYNIVNRNNCLNKLNYKNSNQINTKLFYNIIESNTRLKHFTERLSLSSYSSAYTSGNNYNNSENESDVDTKN